MLIDSHCHLEDYPDLPQILANARASGVAQLLAIGIGEGPDTMHRALEIAHAHPQVFASAGIHPQEAHQADPANLTRLARLAADPRCIAIGEIGLDYYHVDNPEPRIQQAAFIAQMEIAAIHRKPIIIHCRTSELATPAARDKFERFGNGPQAAWDDLLNLLAKYWANTDLPGIMHCFSGKEDHADASIAAGFYLSFAGNLTYPKSTTIQHVARHAPEDRILVETDAPFLAPIPVRGQTNEPANVVHTAQFLAQLRHTSFEEPSRLPTANFHRLFPTTAG